MQHKIVPINKKKYIHCFILVSTQAVRLAHTDIRVPDFTEYRRDATKDPASRNRDNADARKNFTYLMAGSK